MGARTSVTLTLSAATYRMGQADSTNGEPNLTYLLIYGVLARPCYWPQTALPLFSTDTYHDYDEWNDIIDGKAAIASMDRDNLGMMYNCNYLIHSIQFFHSFTWVRTFSVRTLVQDIIKLMARYLFFPDVRFTCAYRIYSPNASVLLRMITRPLEILLSTSKRNSLNINARLRAAMQNSGRYQNSRCRNSYM